jgi:hypothetical protein
VRYGPNSPLIEAFLHRLAVLSADELGTAVARWRARVGAAWFVAEDALRDVLRQLDREKARQALAGALTRSFEQRRESGIDASSAPTVGTEACAQYVVMSALLAFLAYDQLSPHHFATLYHPFAELLPLVRLHDGSGPSAG